VDEPRNALIYQGEPAQWERMLTLVRQMDKAPRQVMIEVTIAEITLSNTTDVGFNWFATHGFGRFDGSIWSGAGSGGTGAPSVGTGLTWLLDVAGQNRVMLKAMAQDSRVNILSTPRLLVKSGSEASMDVGDEIPTVSMTTTSGQQTGGSTNLLQSIQYRKTGVLLKIKPTVYSDNRVDIDLTQEVSKASDEAPSQSTAASAASPTIRNRVINTSLTLKDGQTVVMGGLMSSDDSDGNTGVPLVKDIPLLGNLFKSRKKVTEKKELVLVIVPYIVENDDQATAVSQAIIDRLQYLDLEQAPRTPPAPAPVPTPAPPPPPPPPSCRRPRTPLPHNPRHPSHEQEDSHSRIYRSLGGDRLRPSRGRAGNPGKRDPRPDLGSRGREAGPQGHHRPGERAGHPEPAGRSRAQGKIREGTGGGDLLW